MNRMNMKDQKKMIEGWMDGRKDKMENITSGFTNE